MNSFLNSHQGLLAYQFYSDYVCVIAGGSRVRFLHAHQSHTERNNKGRQ